LSLKVPDVFTNTHISKMNKEQEGKGFPTPVARVARLLRAVEPEDTFDCLSSHSSLDSYANWLAKGSPAGAEIEVSVDSVVVDEALQIRAKTDPSVILRYAEAIEAGAKFDAVSLACIDGVLVLIDGFHRFHARKSLGEQKIKAKVSVMDYEQSRWAAASANMKNGVPLRASEVLEAFHVFMDTFQYRVGYSWLSYRQIAEKLGKPHSTIRNWIKKYYPRIFRHYKQKEVKGSYKDWDEVPSGPGKRSSKADSLAIEVVKQAQTAMKNTMNLGGTLDPSSRGELIEALRETLQELEKLPYFLPVQLEF
jgi:hypothetical protein